MPRICQVLWKMLSLPPGYTLEWSRLSGAGEVQRSNPALRMSLCEVHPTHPMSSQERHPWRSNRPKGGREDSWADKKGRLSRHKECVCKAMDGSHRHPGRFWEASVSQHWRTVNYKSGEIYQMAGVQGSVSQLTLNGKVLSVPKTKTKTRFWFLLNTVLAWKKN